MNYLKTKLTIAEQLAAEVIVTNEFMIAAEGTKRTYSEIAAELGTTRQTLHRWRNNPVFNEYMQKLSDQRLAAHRAKADAMLLKLIDGTSNNGTGSIKALQLYYQLEGRLVNRSEVITKDITQPRLSQAEIDEGIRELAEKLRED